MGPSDAPQRPGAHGGTAREARVLFVAAALPSFALYVLTLAPTVTAEDSGELITSAHTLGVAHPPGYPLWCILGKVSTLLPFGSIAWRVNLLSAVLGALSVGLLAVLAFGLTRGFGVSLASALAFAVSRDFWGQAVIAEVYTLNVLAILLMLWLVLSYDEDRQTGRLYLAAVIAGLGLSNHSTMGPLIPLFFGWVLVREPRLLLRPVLLLNLAASFLLGLSIVLYLPIRSAVDPVMDWGNPETLSATLDHLLRRDYTETRVTAPRTIARQAALALNLIRVSAAQFTPFLVPLVLLGALECFRRRRASFFLLAPLLVLTSYGFVWLLNRTPGREHFYLSRVFFLPAHAVAALWIAMALRAGSLWLGRKLDGRLFLKPLLVGVGALLVLLPLLTHFRRNDRSGDYLAYDWCRNILESLEPDAIIVPTADHSTFPLIYLQAVEGLRPDVTIADKYGYIDDAVFRDLFRGKAPPPFPPPVGGTRKEKERYLIEYSGRPVYFTSKRNLAGLPAYELVMHGLVFEAVRKSEGKPDLEEERRLWERTAFRPGSLGRPPGDFPSDLILSDYHYARGRHALLHGHEDEALEEFRRAMRYGEGIKEIYNNLAGSLVDANLPVEALPFIRGALALDPTYGLAVRNLAGVLFALERYVEGRPWFRKALRPDWENPVFWLGLARGYKAEGRKYPARRIYERLLARDRRSEGLRSEFKEFIGEAFGEETLKEVESLLAAPTRERRVPELGTDPHPRTPPGHAYPPDPARSGDPSFGGPLPGHTGPRAHQHPALPGLPPSHAPQGR